MTQRQLADLSTVSVRAIRDLELGHTLRPQHNTLRLIADGLGLDGSGRTTFMASAYSQGEESKWRQDLQLMAPPVPLTPLLFRDMELAALTELVGSFGHRLVTVTGLPGVGKTRLMIEVACRLHDTGRSPVLWSSRDTTQDPGRAGPLATAIRAAVGAAPLTLAGPLVAGASTESLASTVEDHSVLLVLDGYEAADLDATGVAHLLQSCRSLRIVITARAPISIRGMRTVPLAPLAVPAARGDSALALLGSVPSVSYLVRLLRHEQPGFELNPANAGPVIELCRRLDGLPAALDSIASWLSVYTLDLLLECVRLDPFSVLTPLSDTGQCDLSSDLTNAIDGLDPADAVWLDRLARVETSWSLGDAARLTGQSAPACAQLISRLLERGLARACDERHQSGFRVLDLVRARRAAPASADLVQAV